MTRLDYDELRLSPNMKRALLRYEPQPMGYRRQTWLHDLTIKALTARGLLSADANMLTIKGEQAWKFALRDAANDRLDQR